MFTRTVSVLVPCLGMPVRNVSASAPPAACCPPNPAPAAAGAAEAATERSAPRFTRQAEASTPSARKLSRAARRRRNRTQPGHTA